MLPPLLKVVASGAAPTAVVRGAASGAVPSIVRAVAVIAAPSTACFVVKMIR